MKKLKLKLHLIVLSLFLVFSCQTGDQLADEAPQLDVRSELPGGVGEYDDDDFDDDSPGTQMIEVTVVYEPFHDRQQARAVYGNALNLNSYQVCPTDSSMEIWLIPYISVEDFFATIDATTFITPLYVGSDTDHGNGGDDEVTGVNPELIEVIEVGITEPIAFIYTNFCQ